MYEKREMRAANYGENACVPTDFVSDRSVREEWGERR